MKQVEVQYQARRNVSVIIDFEHLVLWSYGVRAVKGEKSSTKNVDLPPDLQAFA